MMPTTKKAYSHTKNLIDEVWLIQRLKKPTTTGLLRDKDNPFSFGGGLRNGGLPEEAMRLLRPIFQFDYMGAAEFEFGAVRQALSAIAQNINDFVAGEVRISNSKIKPEKWVAKMYNPLPRGSSLVYYFCNKEVSRDVEALILLLATKPYRKEVKAYVGLRNALLIPKEEEYKSDVCGWLEIDHGFFFFTDREMFEKTVAVMRSFGSTLHLLSVRS